MKNALGRGLDALFTDSLAESITPDNTALPVVAAEVDLKDQVIWVEVSLLKPNTYQPRKYFDPRSLAELTASVREKGILEPLLVRPDPGGRYMIIAGERRWRAAQAAEHKKVPVLIKTIDDMEALELAIIENVQREDLNPIEEADSYRMLMELFGLNQEEVGRKVGRERSSVANALRLLKLPQAIQLLLGRGAIAMGHARALLPLADPKLQLSLAEKVQKEQLSVRQLEQIVRDIQHGAGKAPATKSPISLEVVAMENTLKQRFATQVKLHYKQGKGKIELSFQSDDELERILALMEVRSHDL